MNIGYIGLGKMGLAMTELLLAKGHSVVAFNNTPDKVADAVSLGAEGASSLEDMITRLATPRVIWIMVPHSAVDSVLTELVDLLSPGDTVIDGGNSPYKETVRRAHNLAEKNIQYLDVGVSGGPAGARNGACMMIGGEKAVYNTLKSLFVDLCVPGGEAYMGKSGAGHFVKMVHNGIEYGMMQAIGEGFELMKKAPYSIDLNAVAGVYNHGSVIESRLIGWLKRAYEENSVELEGISGEVKHSGEGLWTVEAGKELGVPVANIEQSLQFRIDSQGNPSYTGKVVSALRNQFGGHDVRS